LGGEPLQEIFDGAGPGHTVVLDLADADFLAHRLALFASVHEAVAPRA
jgi:hypothetical protein